MLGVSKQARCTRMISPPRCPLSVRRFLWDEDDAFACVKRPNYCSNFRNLTLEVETLTQTHSQIKVRSQLNVPQLEAVGRFYNYTQKCV